MRKLLGSNYFGEFVKFFTEFNLVSFACIAIGLMLVIIEFNHRDGKRLLIFGCLFMLVGVGIRWMMDMSFFMLFMICLIIGIILVVSYVAFTIKNKKAWLVKGSTLAVNLGVLPDSKNTFSFLIGLEGDANTAIAPNGQMLIDDVSFFVSTDSSPISIGQRVKVVSVDGQNIFVKAIETEEFCD